MRESVRVSQTSDRIETEKATTIAPCTPKHTNPNTDACIQKPKNEFIRRLYVLRAYTHTSIILGSVYVYVCEWMCLGFCVHIFLLSELNYLGIVEHTYSKIK